MALSPLKQLHQNYHASINYQAAAVAAAAAANNVPGSTVPFTVNDLLHHQHQLHYPMSNFANGATNTAGSFGHGFDGSFGGHQGVNSGQQIDENLYASSGSGVNSTTNASKKYFTANSAYGSSAYDQQQSSMQQQNKSFLPYNHYFNNNTNLISYNGTPLTNVNSSLSPSSSPLYNMSGYSNGSAHLPNQSLMTSLQKSTDLNDPNSVAAAAAAVANLYNKYNQVHVTVSEY